MKSYLCLKIDYMVIKSLKTLQIPKKALMHVKTLLSSSLEKISENS